MAWKPELEVGAKEWGRNNLCFATREEAEISAQDTYNRWMMATGWRAVEVDDQEPNYIIDLETKVMRAVEPSPERAS